MSVPRTRARRGMRFHVLHKTSTYALACGGFAVLVFSGELGVLLPVLLVVAVIASWFVEEPLVSRPGWIRLWNGVTVAVFATEVLRGTFAGTVLTPAVELAAFLQVNRLFNRRTARDYTFVSVLAFTHLVGATVLDSDLSYAACFVAFLLLAPWTLTLGHLRREIERNYTGPEVSAERILRSRRIVSAPLLFGMGALSAPLFGMTAALFLLFPRLGFGLLVSSPRHGEPVVGFSDSIDLGGFGVLREDPSVVLRLEPAPLPPSPPRYLPIYLRGTAFDRYTGRGWRRTPRDPEPLRPEFDEYRLKRFRVPEDAEIQVWLEPLTPPVVFVTPNTVSLRIVPRREAGIPRQRSLSRGAEDEIRHVDTDDLGLAYTLHIGRSGRFRVHAPDAPQEVARYLQVPALPARVLALARRWVDGATDPLEKARRISKRLRDDYHYTRELPGDGPEGSDPLTHFLLHRKAGHCEFFSTALAVLLRAEGIPTRNVTGFLGATYNAYGRFYAVREANAHSWVEAYIPGTGWMTLDATPAARGNPAPDDDAWDAVLAVQDALHLRWQKWVLSFDLGRQISLFRGARRWFAGDGWARGERGVRPEPARRGTPPWVYVGVLAGLGVTFAVVARLRGGRLFARLGRGLTSAKVPAEVRLYEALERTLADRGRARPPARTPTQHADVLRAEGFAGEPLVEEVTRAYVGARFAGERLSWERVADLRRRIRDGPT